MTSEQYYNATQRQRALERDIRLKKEQVRLTGLAGSDTAQLRLELGAAQGRLKAFVDGNGLTRNPAREKAYGIGAQPRALKAVPEVKSFYYAAASPIYINNLEDLDKNAKEVIPI